MKETYENMRNLLNFIDYDKYKRQICDDLEVIGLLGMQQGYTNYTGKHSFWHIKGLLCF
jgi:hypothetical protein